jgi:murein DD-endopeptidase MepM/ murein hydrolase activator NlpD
MRPVSRVSYKLYDHAARRRDHRRFRADGGDPMAKIRVVLAAVSLAVPLLVGAASAASAGTPTASATAPAATYSAANWFPLHDSQEAMDCYVSNPGCPVSHRHKDRAITWLTHDTLGKYHNVNVYAAGSGIAHIGHSGIGQCTPVAGQPLGNWVWIDHSNGVVSRYAHLYAIKIHNGQQVTPRTIIAESGSSGESAAQCKYKYLNFQVEHGAKGGANGTGYEFTTLLACNGSSTVHYPASFSSYQSWNAFPKSTYTHGPGWKNMIPRGGRTCLP